MKSGEMRRVLAFVLTNLAISILVPASSMASGWLGPETLQEENGPVRFGPYAVMADEGEAVEVWGGSGGRNETSRPPGGPWAAPGTLTGDEAGPGHPCVGEGPGGETLVVWPRFHEGQLIIRATIRLPGVGWSTAVDLGTTPYEALQMGSCDVAIDASGDAVAVWSVETVFEFESVWAAYRPSGAAWESAVELRSPEALFVRPTAAIDSAGEALVAWGGGRIQTADKPPTEGWGEPETLSETGHFATLADIAVDDSGDALAAWQFDRGFEENVVQAASRPAGAGWEEPEDLSAGEHALTPQAEMDAAGNGLVVWETSEAGHHVIESAERPDQGAWQHPVDLSPPGELASRPSLAMNQEGDALVAWEAQNGGTWSVRGTARPVGGTWAQPSPISAGGPSGELFPPVGIDSEGDGVATWLLQEGPENLVQAAGYDVVAPKLSAPDIPPSGVAGFPVGMSVLASDVWSPAPQVRWHFGGGSSASGPNVSHVYGGAGVYLVTVESEDLAGNVTTLQRTISIASPPPPEPSPTPSSRFRIVRAKVHHSGRITLLLRVAGPGKVRAKARGKLPGSGFTFNYRSARASTRAAGKVRLALAIPSRAAAAVRKGARRLRVQVVVSFAPQGGATNVRHLSLVSCLGNCSGTRR